jgi:hypothetical protein
MLRVLPRASYLSSLYLIIFVVLLSASAPAIDIPGIQPAALDQPRINALLRRTAGGAPLTADFGTGPIFNIQAFLDTGASGVLLSTDTADFLGVVRSRFPSPGGPLVVFEDVGVGGSSPFNVSETLHVSLARFHPDTSVDDPATLNTEYNQSQGPLRAQIGPLVDDPNPLLAGLDVFGMPVMAGKVVVFDPKPVDTFLDTMRTYIYNAGTPFNPSTADSQPGIPTTNRHVELSYASFDRFTETTPVGAAPPTLRNNPFIGPNPVAQLDPNPPADITPGVTVSLGNLSTTGSFLLDTGAAASILSKHLAEDLHVRYRAGTEGSDNPRLEKFDPSQPALPGTLIADQFQFTVGGTGGTEKAAGFFLDSMLVRTMEGNPLSDVDPNHLRFLGAPFLVHDITVQDPVTSESLTLDGVLGMNYLVANAFITESLPLPSIENLTASPFNWITFDEPNGILGLDVKAVPEPSSVALFGVALVIAIPFRGVRRRLRLAESFQKSAGSGADYATNQRVARVRLNP